MGSFSLESDVLGDPNFPTRTLAKRSVSKSALYQDLYSRYSRLVFTFSADRSIAIAGLEKRLLLASNTQGAYGVSDYRSLLWMRAADVSSLLKIEELRHTKIPTWSWMAYQGAIQYLDIPYRGIEWLGEEVLLPWRVNSEGGDHPAVEKELSATIRPRGAYYFAGDDISTADQELSATIRPSKQGFQNMLTTNGTIVLDMPEVDHDWQKLRYATIGRSKLTTNMPLEGKRMYAILLVLPQDDKYYERVGVGLVPSTCLQMEDQGEQVKIR